MSRQGHGLYIAYVAIPGGCIDVSASFPELTALKSSCIDVRACSSVLSFASAKVYIYKGRVPVLSFVKEFRIDCC